MDSELETFLGKVEERLALARKCAFGFAPMHHSVADVKTLVALVRKFIIRFPPKRGHTNCLCGRCTHYELLNRHAREAREERPKQSLGEEIIEGLTELKEHLATGKPLSGEFRVNTRKRDA